MFSDIMPSLVPKPPEPNPRDIGCGCCTKCKLRASDDNRKEKQLLKRLAASRKVIKLEKEADQALIRQEDLRVQVLEMKRNTNKQIENLKEEVKEYNKCIRTLNKLTIESDLLRRKIRALVKMVAVADGADMINRVSVDFDEYKRQLENMMEDIEMAKVGECNLRILSHHHRYNCRFIFRVGLGKVEPISLSK